MEPWGTGTHIIPLRLLRRKLNALTPFVASTYPCKDMLQKNMHAGRHCKKSNSVWRVTFDYPLHPHTAHTHTHNLMVPSDITVSHFKEFGSEHSYVWYLKHPPKVLRVSSSHTHTLYTLTHTHTHTVLHLSRNILIGPSEEPSRGRVKKYKKSEEGFFLLLRICLMVHLLYLHFFTWHFLSCLCCLHIITLVLLVQAPSNRLYGLTLNPSWYRLYK